MVKEIVGKHTVKHQAMNPYVVMGMIPPNTLVSFISTAEHITKHEDIYVKTLICLYM